MDTIAPPREQAAARAAPTPARRGAMAANAVLAGIVAVYAGARTLGGGSGPVVDLAVAANVALVFAIFLLLGAPIHVLVGSLAEARAGAALSPRTARWRTRLRRHITADGIVAALVAWVAVSVLYTVYLQWKAEIGVSVPFSWDTRLAELDRRLHFGVDPWRLTHAVFAAPAATAVIDFVYHKVWGFVILAMPGIMAWSRNTAERTRFFVVFALAWIVLGTLGAYLLPSAGPVFFEQVVTGDVRFRALTDHLVSVHASTPLTAVSASEYLRFTYSTAAWPRVGISAMPSMHIAVATIAMLVLWQRGAVLRTAGVGFLAVMLVGSVHLGWHYAVDGYVSIAVVALLWFATERAARRWMKSA